MTIKLASAVLFLSLSVPALAVEPQAKADPKKSDGDRVVCERYEETGSRLGSRRICKTVREWEEERRVTRSEVEKAQQNTGMPSSN